MFESLMGEGQFLKLVGLLRTMKLETLPFTWYMEDLAILLYYMD